MHYNFAYTCPPPPCRFTPDHPHQHADAPTSVTRFGARGKNVHQLNASNELTIGPPHKADCAHRLGILHLLIVTEQVAMVYIRDMISQTLTLK